MFNAAEFNLSTQSYTVSKLMADARETYVSLFTDSKTMRCIGPVLSTELAEQHFIVAVRSSAQVLTSQLYLSIKLPKQTEVIGIFNVRVVSLDKRVEIGIMLLRKYHRSGLAKDVVKAVCERIFTRYKVESIFCNIKQHNLAAKKLVESLGFVKVDSVMSYRLHNYCLKVGLCTQ